MMDIEQKLRQDLQRQIDTSIARAIGVRNETPWAERPAYNPFEPKPVLNPGVILRGPVA